MLKTKRVMFCQNNEVFFQNMAMFYQNITVCPYNSTLVTHYLMLYTWKTVMFAQNIEVLFQNMAMFSENITMFTLNITLFILRQNCGLDNSNNCQLIMITILLLCIDKPISIKHFFINKPF